MKKMLDSWESDTKHAGQETSENAVHTFNLMWCYSAHYDGTEASCTFIQRAKHFILLKACCLEFMKITEEYGTLLKLQTCEKKVIFLED